MYTSLVREVNSLSKLDLVTKSCVVFSLWAAAAALSAQTFTTLHNFSGPDGSAPNATLVQGPDGNLYGTSFYGGVHNAGTLYKITPGGALTTLYIFCSLSNCADGSNPQSALILGPHGSFYGTTDYGGSSGNCSGGCGTIFQLGNGALTTLHSFDGTDGLTPQGGLVLGADGNLYGTTLLGGAGYSGLCIDYCGTVFTITPTGDFTTLVNFDYNNGYISYSPLFQSNASADLYGTSYAGGANGVGEVYQIGTGGLTILHSFEIPGLNGDRPIAGLAQDQSGLLYGFTLAGGAGGYGTFFSITPSGHLTTLYAFDGTHGGTPLSIPGPALGSDGQFYGTTSAGGASGDGTIFSITTSGVFADLHDFDGTDGEYPTGLAQTTDGVFYGAAAAGGANSDGTVFSVSLGLAPFVQPVPGFGRSGATVHILGSNLTGSTSVTFDGIAASFTVVSPTEIAATVPAGASRGLVQVVTPTTTLASKLPFNVLP
jgi:uncharacterized repeat protein (TIGR03803 family)